MADLTDHDRPSNRGVLAFLGLSVLYALIDITIGGRYTPRGTLIVTDVLGVGVEALFVYLVRWRRKRWPWTVGAVLAVVATLLALATIFWPEAGDYDATPARWFLILQFCLVLLTSVLWFSASLRPLHDQRMAGPAEADTGSPAQAPGQGVA